MAAGEEQISERPARRRASLGVRISLAMGSLLVATLLAECALRVARPNPFRDERPDWVLPLRIPHIGMNLPVDRSGIDPASPVAMLRTDERGYLLPSRRFENPDATIAFLGGSTTECSALDAESRWPALVGSLLAERGLRVDTLNAGKSGNTSHDALNILLNHVVQDEPDVAVLMEAANDFGVLARDPSYSTRSGGPMTARLPLRWLLQTASQNSALFGAGRQWVMLGQVDPGTFVRPPRRVDDPVLIEPFEQRLRGFVALCRAFEIVPVLMTQPFTATRTALTPEWTDASDQERFNQAIREVARDEAATLIDLAQHVSGIEGWDQPMRVFYDGIHVTQGGAQVYAEYVTKRLLEALPSLGTKPSDLHQTSSDR